MSRILVAGGAGYIGSHMVKMLGEAGDEVVTYDNSARPGQVLPEQCREFAQSARRDRRTRNLQLHFQLHGSGVRRTAISPHRRSAPKVAQRVTGRPIQAVDGARRAGDPARLVADATGARTELNWKPRYADLESIIAHAWNWEMRFSRRPQIAGAQLSR